MVAGDRHRARHRAAASTKLEAYVPSDIQVFVRPAPRERDWMDETGQHAYRCLPLTIANAHGWEILCPDTFVIEWTGGAGKDALSVKTASNSIANNTPVSAFGHGIVTFSIGVVFRTSPGFDLWIGSPANRFKHGIQGLNGVVETDWTNHPFTMNWKMTAPGSVTFARGEPFCMFFPVARGMVEDIEPKILRAETELAVSQEIAKFRRDRTAFNEALAKGDPEAVKQEWQGDYFRGPSHAISPPHRTKLQTKPFRKTDKT